MKKFIGAFMSAGIASAAIAPSHAQEQAKDSIIVLGVTDWENSYLKDPVTYPGHDVAVFGLRIGGNNETVVYETMACGHIIHHNRKNLAFLLDHYKSPESLQRLFNFLQIQADPNKVDLEAMKASLPAAIKKAAELCALNIS